MKIRLKRLELFTFGFILAALLNLTSNCSEKNSPTQPEDKIDPPTTDYLETQPMKNLSDSLISAFNLEDKSKVISCLSEDTRDIYGEILNNSTASLKAFGKGLENRKLVFANQLYAEYEITVDGKIYSIAYVSCGDDIWHLSRL